MVILNAHFDGKVIIPDQPHRLPFRSGTRLKITVELIDETADGVTPSHGAFRPLNIAIDPELSNAIALTPPGEPLRVGD